MSVSYVDSTILVPAGSRTTVAIPVPTGPAANDIAVVGVYKETTAAITPPSGFSQVAFNDTNATSQGALYVFWKRLTGADSGTYDFSWTGNSYAGGHAALIRGCVESGSPWAGTPTIVRTANNSGNSISHSAASVLNGLGISFVSSWATATRTWTAPSGWLKEEQSVNQATGYKASMSASTTGTVTWVGNGNDYYQMFIGTLVPPPSGVAAYAVIGGVKKLVTPYSVISGLKKSTSLSTVVGGVRK